MNAGDFNVFPTSVDFIQPSPRAGLLSEELNQ